MTTMAAIDRLVHHSVILDMMSVESYRAEVASQQHLSSSRSKKASPKQAPLRETVTPLSAVEQTDSETSEVTRPSARLIDADGPV